MSLTWLQRLHTDFYATTHISSSAKGPPFNFSLPFIVLFWNIEASHTTFTPLLVNMETKGHVPTEEENRHRSAAIAYQLKQLPRNSGFPVQRWRELFSPITLPVPTYEIQENPPIDSGGSALVWKLDPHMVRCGAFVKYREYGYDKDGDLCILGQDPLHKAGFGGRTISSFSTASDATSMSDFLTEHIVSTWSNSVRTGIKSNPLEPPGLGRRDDWNTKHPLWAGMDIWVERVARQ